MEKIRALIAKFQAFVDIARKNQATPQGQKIAEFAKTRLGQDASPNDIAPDEYGCAETVSTVLKDSGLNEPVIVSTAVLYQHLLTSPNWLQVESPLAGDVIISPTGMGGLNGVSNGHTGIMADSMSIMSNNSYTGKFEQNYTLPTWTARYKTKGGYPVFFFRRIA